MLNKDEAYQVLVAQKEELSHLESLVERQAASKLRSHLNSRLVKVVQGIRRCGKSSLCLQVLRPSETAYANFDDERLIGVTTKDLQSIYTSLREIYPKASTFFFDEVQNIPGWELFVNRLQRSGVNIVITGSNGKLLGKELATHLTGRQISLYLQPFSFVEFREFRETLGTRYSSNRECFQDYFKTGGFPEVIRGEDQRIYLQELFDKIISRDVIQRFRLRETKLVKELALYLIQNSAQKTSFKNLMNRFQFRSINTVRKYVEYLKDVFLIHDLRGYSYKLTERSTSRPKIYACDVGLMSALWSKPTEDVGARLETLMFNYLVGEGREIYYFNEGASEVDFGEIQDRKVVRLIQVTCSLSDESTRTREIKSLLAIGKKYECKNLLIITLDQTADLRENGQEIKVRTMHDFCVS